MVTCRWGLLFAVWVCTLGLPAAQAPAPVAPVWVDAAFRLTAEAQVAMGVLAGADEHGLRPDDYDVAALQAMSERLTAGPPDPAAALAFDERLTTRMARFWRDLHSGRVDPRTLGFTIAGAPDDHDFVSLLRTAATQGRVASATTDWMPPLPLYRDLTRALGRYRALAASALPLAMPLPAKGIAPGQPLPAARALAARLMLLGDLPPGDAPAGEIYGPALVEAVMRFQARHGLAADGVLGRGTVAALLVPLDERVRQIERALERLRWLPHLDGQGLLAVNIPMFRLWGWDTLGPDGVPAFAMDVIVGRALNTRTPVLIAEMRHVIFRPYWNVPRSILRGELLPALARDAGYFARHDLEIVDGERDDSPVVPMSAEAVARLGRGELRVRQRPGPANSLGLVKFEFPNDQSIYMHGTPAPQLFGRARRDFSHGCVRVADPAALAAWVLREEPGWTTERIARAMQAPRPERVALSRPRQVVLYYLTAIVMPETGVVHFAEDVYGHDATLDRALAARR
jgi:L,D-transpeptidase YcbB